ncbi:MAG TPA: threonine/serine dehydratase [Roseiflexaceae bacterium]|nr:threonine/serine dehydratase [Roseiflexaceae bacterium]
MNEPILPIDMIRAARDRIPGYIRHTPLLPQPALRDDLPPRLRLKLENLQLSGSFKARGVFNTLLQLDETARVRGVIAASGGNHGVALAYGARRLGIPAIVYLPATASPDRVARVEHWGAQVIRFGRNWDDAHTAAIEHANRSGMPYVHPFDALPTLAGQGTLGLELLDALPQLDCVLIGIGGGGLIGGVAAAIRQQQPGVRIIGVEPIGAPSMLRSIEAGRLVPLSAVHTIADTLAPRAVSERTLALARAYVDEIVLVSDAEMVEAMRWLWLECNQLVEPAGAAAIAAIQSGAADVSRHTCPVAIICGGNAAAESVFAAYQPQEEA